MKESGVRAVIVGGGLGGLALGAGLRRSGIGTTVLERDDDLAATGGYHITLQGPVQEALAALLPPHVLEYVLASSADGRLRDPDVMWDRHGRRVGTVRLKTADLGIDIDRITLRLLLADAVGDDLRTGQVVTGVEHRPDGRPIVRLDGGSSLEADVVIGADGVHSTVARALADGDTSTPTGLVGISGRTLVDALDPEQARRLGTRSSLAVGPHATALYLGYLDPVGHAVLDLPRRRRAVTTAPTFIWGAMVRESEATRRLAALDGPELRDATADLLAARDWSPRLTDVVRRCDGASVGLFRFHAGPHLAVRQAPWPAGPVTALGDAVHATPPTAGMGAGAAIRDAADLARELTSVEAGAKTLPVAVRDFEARMRVRGAEVIEAAMSTVRIIRATDTTVGAAATRVALPLMAGVQRLLGAR